MEKIISEAIKTFKPKKFLLLFSGGHDSLCSTHYSADCLQQMGIDFTVYHGNTGIGIRETREYVMNTCAQFGWKVFEGHPPKECTYEDMVRRYGFPGPASHRYMYRMLKERALRRYVTYACKAAPKARENVLLITGIRQSESKIRMGYKEYLKKEGSRIWCSPIFFWTKTDVDKYMSDHRLPRNPVKDKICVSGECLCGAFASNEEWTEIKHSFPETAMEIERLRRIAIRNGHPWEWASCPKKYYKNHPLKRANMFMCIGCEEKNRKEGKG